MVHGLPYQLQPDFEGLMPQAGALCLDQQLCGVQGAGRGHIPPTSRNSDGDVFLGDLRHNLYDMARVANNRKISFMHPALQAVHRRPFPHLDRLFGGAVRVPKGTVHC